MNDKLFGKASACSPCRTGTNTEVLQDVESQGSESTSFLPGLRMLASRDELRVDFLLLLPVFRVFASSPLTFQASLLHLGMWWATITNTELTLSASVTCETRLGKNAPGQGARGQGDSSSQPTDPS